MMSSVLRHLRRNVIAYAALFVALGGTSYAAIKLPANSVGTRQLKKGAVTAAKIKTHSLLAKDFKAGQLRSGAQGPIGPQGPAGRDGTNGQNGKPGQDGAPGQDGRTVLNGVGAPPDSSGTPGDFYVDTATDQIYGPKSSAASGAWGSGVALKGATGPSYWTALTQSVPTLALNNFYYGAVQGVSTATASEDNVSMLSPGEDVVARNLRVELSAAPGSGNFVHIVMDDGQSVGLNCVVDDPATTCSDPGPHTIPAGSQIAWSVSGLTTSGLDARITFETTPAS
jgi:hypothetical protein